MLRLACAARHHRTTSSSYRLAQANRFPNAFARLNKRSHSPLSSNDAPQLRASDARTINAYIGEQPGAVAAFLQLQQTSKPQHEVTQIQSRLAQRDARYLLKLSAHDPELYSWELFHTIALARLTNNDLALPPDELPRRANQFAETSGRWWLSLSFKQQAAAFMPLCLITQLIHFRLSDDIVASHTPSAKTLGVLANDHLNELTARTSAARGTETLGQWATLLLRSHAFADSTIPDIFIPGLGDLDAAELQHAHDTYRGPLFAPDTTYFDPCRQRLSFDPHSPEQVETAETLCVDDLAITGPPLLFEGTPRTATLQRNYALSQRNLALTVTADYSATESEKRLLEAARFAVQLSGQAGLQASQYTDPASFAKAHARIQKLYPMLPERFEPKPDAPPLTISVTTELTTQHLELLYPIFHDSYGLGPFATRPMVEAFLARELHKHGEPSPTSLQNAGSSLPDEYHAQIRRLFPDAYGA